MGGKVGVVAEDLARADIFRQLDEEAGLAHHDTERVIGFGAVGLVRSQEAFAWRHAEIDEIVLEESAAQPARMQWLGRRLQPGLAGLDIHLSLRMETPWNALIGNSRD